MVRRVRRRRPCRERGESVDRRRSRRRGRRCTPYVPSSLYVRNADGSGREQRLFAGAVDELVIPFDWSPDGRYILFGRSTLALVASDIWALPTTGDGKAFPLITSPFAKGDVQLSPDGRWIAYVTSDSNGPQIVVRPFPRVDRAQWQVSIDGGQNPSGARTGKSSIGSIPTAKSWPSTYAPPKRSSSSERPAHFLQRTTRPRSGPTTCTTRLTASGSW